MLQFHLRMTMRESETTFTDEDLLYLPSYCE